MRQRSHLDAAFGGLSFVFVTTWFERHHCEFRVGLLHLPQAEKGFEHRL